MTEPTSTPEPTDPPERPGRKDQVLGTTTSLSTVVGLMTGVLTLVNDPGGTWKAVVVIAFAVALVTGVPLLYRIRSRRISLGPTVLIVFALLSLATLAVWTTVVRGGGDRSDDRAVIDATPPRPTTPVPTTAPGPGTTTASPAPTACPGLQNAARVVRGPGDTGSGPRLARATYMATPTDKPGIEWAGQVAGRPPAGQVLYLVGTADPTTVDSTPEHHPGVPNFLLIEQINPDENGCWAVTQRQLYDCAGGITFVYHLLQMSEQQARGLEQRKQTDRAVQEDGFEPGEFRSMPITFLDSFQVPTRPGPTCGS